MSRRPRANPGSLWVLGVDASLTRTGLAMLPPGWEPGDWSRVAHHSCGEAPPAKPDREQDPSYHRLVAFERARIERMARLAEAIAEWVFEVSQGAHVAGFVEGYSHSQGNEAHAASIREFGGIFRWHLAMRCGISLVPIAEASARKILLGKCPPRDRKAVTEAALKSAGAPFPNVDVCDAFAISNAGLSVIGLPFMSLA